jgi:isoquinoline 1-oxidoreductase beta subunit
VKRRTWLLGTTVGAGALLVAWGLTPQRSRLGLGNLMLPGEGDMALNGWIKVLPDGAVVLAMPRSEMGQGVHTALPMLAAEELDVPLSAMRIEQAGADAIYGNVAMLVASLPFHPGEEEREDGFGRVKASRWLVGKVARELGINATGGSSSVADAWEVVRVAAATARASLVGAASLQWKLPVEDLSVVNGVVTHPSGLSAPYGELARHAAATPPGEVRLKERKDWRLIGRPAPRLDVAAKVDGTARFGIDVRLPGMLHAALRLSPMLGGAPGRIDAAAAMAMPGVRRFVQLPAFAGSTAGIAIVADSHWQAQQAVRAVEVEWLAPPQGLLDTRAIAKQLEEAVKARPGHQFHARGDVEQAERNGGNTIEAWYSAPYLAHATLEPMNATARVQGDRVEVWAPTQVPQMCRGAAARVARVPTANVDLHVTLLGGGFGRRLEVRAGATAVVARGRHRPRLLSSDARCALARHHRPHRSADGAAGQVGRGRDHAALDRARPACAGGACGSAGQDGLRGPLRPALRLRTPEDGARLHPLRRAGRLLALGRALPQRLLYRVVHRRDRGRAQA